MVVSRPWTAAFCVSLGELLASADSAPRVGFGFGIRDTFQHRLVGIFSGFLFSQSIFCCSGLGAARRPLPSPPTPLTPLTSPVSRVSCATAEPVTIARANATERNLMSVFLSACYCAPTNNPLAAMTFGNLRYVPAASRQCRDQPNFDPATWAISRLAVAQVEAQWPSLHRRLYVTPRHVGECEQHNALRKTQFQFYPRHHACREYRPRPVGHGSPSVRSGKDGPRFLSPTPGPIRARSTLHHTATEQTLIWPVSSSK